MDISLVLVLLILPLRWQGTFHPPSFSKHPWFPTLKHLQSQLGLKRHPPPPNPTPGSLSWSLSLSVLQHCRLPGWKPWIPPAPTLFCVCVPSMAQAPSLLNPTNLPCNFWEGREGSSQEMGTPHPPLYPEFL